jgi:predicted secreted protein
MSFTTALAIYALIWSVVIFAILPWGVRSQAESGDVVPGSEPGAPAVPHLGQKLMWNTVLSTAIFALFYLAYTREWVSLDDLATLWGMLR